MKLAVNALKRRSKIKISKMGWLTYTAKNVIVKEIWPSLNRDFWLKKKKKKYLSSKKRMRTWKNKFLSKDRKRNANIMARKILNSFAWKTKSLCASDVCHSITNISKALNNLILKILKVNLKNCFHFFKI